MLTYRETRVLFVESDSLTFPTDVEVTVVLAPNPVFGDREGGHTVRKDDSAKLIWNANTGRSLAKSNNPLAAALMDGTIGDFALTIRGHTATARWTTPTRDELMGKLALLHFVLPYRWA